MAEFIMKDKIAKAGLTNEFCIDSKAISTEEEGNELYYAAREKLKEKNIPYEKLDEKERRPRNVRSRNEISSRG